MLRERQVEYPLLSEEINSRERRENQSFDFFRLQYVTKPLTEEVKRSTSIISDEDDKDEPLDTTVNLLPQDPIRNPPTVYDEYANVKVPTLEKSIQSVKGKSSILKRFLSFSFTSSSKIYAKEEETVLSQLPVIRNSSKDHSSTKIKTLQLSESTINALNEADEILTLYNGRKQPPSSSGRINSQNPEIGSSLEITAERSTSRESIHNQVISQENFQSQRFSTHPMLHSTPLNTNQMIASPMRRRLPTIIWNPELAPSLTYLDPIEKDTHYNILAKNHKGKILTGEYFYDPPPGTVLSGGKQKLSITFIPHDAMRFLSTAEERYIEIQKRKPQLSWNYTGGNIIYLTPLSESVYSCVECELSGGTYEYSHPVGSILELGAHQLNVKYYPSEKDSSNYTFGYAHIKVEVTGTVIPLTWKFPGDDDQFAENKIISDEIEVKKMIAKRSLADIGKLGFPIIYPDHLPQWLFCAKCLLYRDENDKTDFTEIEGEYEYSHQPNMILPAGFHTITATFYPYQRDKYHHSSASRTIFIYRNRLTLSWKKCYSLIDGEVLDESVLNCEVAPQIQGVFHYQPPVGTILPIGTHKLSVRFIPEEPSNYLPEEHGNEMRIRPKKQLKINWFPPEEITYSTPLSLEQLSACLFGYGSSTKGKFVFSPDFGAILPVGEHLLTVEFHSENVIFENVSSSVSLTVIPSPSKLIWPTPNAIYAGEGIADNILNCDCANTQGVFHYSVKKGEVLSHGTHTLTCQFLPHDTHNYLPAKITVQLVVYERPKFQPKLTWKHPHENEYLEYGFALNGHVLNAKCINFPGTFSYTPGFDTILPVGKHELTAYFTPEEKHKCLAGNIKNYIEIMKRTPAIVWYPSVKINEKTKIYEFSYGHPFRVENYLTAYAVMSDSDNTRVFGEFIYTTKKRNILLKKITINPKKQKSVLLQGLSKKTATEEEADEKSSTEISVEEIKEEMTKEVILDCGEHVLKCTFIPADSHNFDSVSSELTVFINRQQPDLLWNVSQTEGKEMSFVYPFSINALPRPTILNKTIKGKFEYTVDSEEMTVETITEEVDDHDDDDDEDGDTHATSKVSRFARIMMEAQNNNNSRAEGNENENEEGSSLSHAEQLSQQLSLRLRKKKIITRHELKLVKRHKRIKPDTVLDVGKHVVTATFYSEDINNFLCNSACISIEVTKAVPLLVWEPTTTVTFGTLLTKYQHGNAYCTNITKAVTGGPPGEFHYDPPMGTVVTIAMADKYNNINELIETLQKQEEKEKDQEQEKAVSLVTNNQQQPSSGTTIPAHASTVPEKHHADLKSQNNANNRILMETIKENYNAIQHNKNYLKINLKMKFYPYSRQNYDIIEMEKELIIERKSANILWSAPYRVPYGKILDEKIFNARLSDQDLSNIEFFFKINHPTKAGSTKQPTKATTPSRFKQLQAQLQEKQQHRFQQQKQLSSTTIPGEENLAEQEPEQHDETMFDLFTLEFDPPINTLLSLTQKEYPIKVTFRPLQNLIYFYNETIKILYMDIYPISPNIVWKAKCTSMQEGNPLEKKLHCNAYVEKSALFPGKLIYHPSVGSLLKPGHYNIVCEYIPKNPANELSIKIEKHFEIVKKPPRIVVEKDPFTGKVTVKRIFEGQEEGGGGPSSPKNSSNSKKEKRLSPSPPRLEQMISSSSASLMRKEESKVHQKLSFDFTDSIDDLEKT
jgi:hypothetical protein